MKSYNQKNFVSFLKNNWILSSWKPANEVKLLSKFPFKEFVPLKNNLKTDEDNLKTVENS